MGDGFVDSAKGFFFFTSLRAVCVSMNLVLLVSCGLIVDWAEPLRGLRWMGVYLNGCSHFTNEVCLAKAGRQFTDM